MELRGRATLEYLLEALRHCARLDGLVVATSIDVSDDATAALAQRCNTPCFRGPLEDVALRILRAGEQHAADAIVRISGDSPLLDPALVDQAVDLFRCGACDAQVSGGVAIGSGKIAGDICPGNLFGSRGGGASE